TNSPSVFSRVTKCKLILAFPRKVFHRQKQPVHNCFTGVDEMDNSPVDKWIRSLEFGVMNRQLWITKADNNGFIHKKVDRIHILWITFGTRCELVDNLVQISKISYDYFCGYPH
ncbi:hypothetical protein, partial [Lentilactobacillus buchneri]|uniref:hypothetical protein n=1 Tax=Lentilactobacillus buchneri TaxID=1581 RepID=UPI0020BD557A